MIINQNELIEGLIEKTKDHLNRAENLKKRSIQQLNQKPDADSWSVLECFEHLNRYGYFYLPEIEKQLKENAKLEAATDFKAGWLGNYFAKSMLPKQKLNKMKTFKSMNPIGSQLNMKTLDVFIQQQKKMLDLLDKARQRNLAKIRTGITLSKWITLRLGDTFRVVIYHNLRHIEQAERIIQA